MLRVLQGASLVLRELAALQAEATPVHRGRMTVPVQWQGGSGGPAASSGATPMRSSRTPPPPPSSTPPSSAQHGPASGDDRRRSSSSSRSSSGSSSGSISSSNGGGGGGGGGSSSATSTTAEATHKASPTKLEAPTWHPTSRVSNVPTGGAAERPDGPTRHAAPPSESSSLASSSSHEAGAGTTTERATRAVPANPVSRAAHFGGLGIGLAAGAAAAAVRRAVNGDASGSLLATEANVDRLAATLCRLRGAALKVGQMLSFNDADVLPPAVRQAMERVRDGADWMPPSQLETTLLQELGDDWRARLASFEEVPVAAASIGQVHRAVLDDGRPVAIKVQYPGARLPRLSSLNASLALLLPASRAADDNHSHHFTKSERIARWRLHNQLLFLRRTWP